MRSVRVASQFADGFFFLRDQAASARIIIARLAATQIE
jgi:hypothetical protein